ncbi:MAG: phosphonate ABC transporter permease, partial [Sphingomonadaceae bacterium]|nr:phosphonate ABC transporter permease [Sphingomonadaceae bacterium]
MLVWSRSGRMLVWLMAVPVFLVIYGLPIGVI